MLHGITPVLFLPLLVWKTRNLPELKERVKVAVAIITRSFLPIFHPEGKRHQDTFP